MGRIRVKNSLQGIELACKKKSVVQRFDVFFGMVAGLQVRTRQATHVANSQNRTVSNYHQSYEFFLQGPDGHGDFFELPADAIQICDGQYLTVIMTYREGQENSFPCAIHNHNARTHFFYEWRDRDLANLMPMGANFNVAPRRMTPAIRRLCENIFQDVQKQVDEGLPALSVSDGVFEKIELHQNSRFFLYAFLGAAGLGALAFLSHELEPNLFDDWFAVKETEASFIAQVQKNANFRERPKTNAKIIGTLQAGSAVNVVGVVDEQPWYKIALGSRTGYVHQSLLKKWK